MRRFTLPLAIAALVLCCAVVAERAGTTRAQQPLPTPKGQLGGPVPLMTQPVLPPTPLATSTPAPTPTPAATATATAPATTHPLIGAWLVTFPDQPSAAPVLLTFTGDGTVSGAVADAASSGFEGAWTATGGPTAAFTVVRLTTGANGSFAGLARLRGTITVAAGGDAWIGLVISETLDSSGKVTATSGPHPARAARISVAPMLPLGAASSGRIGTPSVP